MDRKDEAIKKAEKSIRACIIREVVAGIPAMKSSLMERTVSDLLLAGLDDNEVVRIVSDFIIKSKTDLSFTSLVHGKH